MPVRGGGGGGGAPTNYAYLGFGTDVTLTAEVDVLGLHLANEFRNFPTYTAIDLDLAALNLWYDSIGTPTTAPTMVDVAGEAGITETYEYAIKCVADAAVEGWEQVYTYADEHRIKSGRRLSGLFAIWVGTAGRTVTVTFRNSTGTTTTATATAQAWTVVEVANHLLAGVSVDVEFTVDGADTFYVVPLGLNIGARGLGLPPRAMRFVDAYVADIVANVDPGGGGYTDVDITANVGNIACGVQLTCLYASDNANRIVRVRRNGDATDTNAHDVIRNPTGGAGVAYFVGVKRVMLDDGQVFEYDSSAPAGDTESLFIGISGYWEWA